MTTMHAEQTNQLFEESTEDTSAYIENEQLDVFERYDEFDDYETDPVFEKSNRHSGVQKMRW